MNLIVLHAELPRKPAVEENETPQPPVSQFHLHPMKSLVHLVKKFQRCLSPRPVRDRRFIEWELPTRLE